MIKVDTDKLKGLKYTESGIKRYVNTVEEYSQRLLEKSQRCAEVRKSSGDEIEVTSEHVQQAVRIISSEFGADMPSKLKTAFDVFELICTGASGFFGSKASSDNAPNLWIVLFILSLGFAIIAHFKKK